MRQKATKTANINVTLYDGALEIYFDCAGSDTCRFALCPVMPPSGEEDCCFMQNGSCRLPAAQQAARITKELKHLSDEE